MKYVKTKQIAPIIKTVAEICTEAPEFWEIIEAVAGSNRKFWYETWSDVKPKLNETVGWFSRHEKLKTIEHYDAAHL
ncbi:MAG: hypothetical protein LBK94_05280, partial [Prevotellaceae bacterium]|nr:hypothetical protein [Prevotellaceae bacterium]